jgi:hypothetical protein
LSPRWVAAVIDSRGYGRPPRWEVAQVPNHVQK